MSTEGLLCPSAPWDAEGGKVFGVVGGTVEAPKVMFLKQLLPPSQELQDKLGGVNPEEVYRVAAPCTGSGCAHHDGASQRCGLVGKIVKDVDQAYQEYATCGIRASCVWWAQEGAKACVRCPQIATRNQVPSEQVARASVITRQQH